MTLDSICNCFNVCQIFDILRLCENVNGDTGKWEEDLQAGEVLSNKTDLSHLNNFKQSDNRTGWHKVWSAGHRMRGIFFSSCDNL